MANLQVGDALRKALVDGEFEKYWKSRGYERC